jgi:hypothetical protein
VWRQIVWLLTDERTLHVLHKLESRLFDLEEQLQDLKGQDQKGGGK